MHFQRTMPKNEKNTKHPRSEEEAVVLSSRNNDVAKRTRSTSSSSSSSTTSMQALPLGTRTTTAPLANTGSIIVGQQQVCSLSISNARRALILMANAQRGQKMISEGQKMIAEGQLIVARPNAELVSLLSSSSREIQNGLALGATTDGDQTTLEDVPDDSMSLIFSFLFRMEKEEDSDGSSYNWCGRKSKARNAKKTFAICSEEIGNVFRTFGFVSLAIRQSLLYHLQNSPVRLREECLKKGLQNVAMVCKFKMKLRDVEYISSTTLGKGIIIHLMKSCDISSVNKLHVSLAIADETNFNMVIDAMKTMGIPRDDENIHLLVSNTAFQQKLARIFFEKRCSPKILTLTLNLSAQFHSPLLINLGVDLKELVLSTRNHKGDCEICSDLLLAIQALPKLKRFELKVPAPDKRSQTKYNAHLLKSSSIEEMKIPGSLGGWRATCPSLTSLTLVGDILDPERYFLAHCPPSVKELRLHGIREIATITVLEAAIKALPQLETLTFDSDSRSSSYKAPDSITINSQSLQVIDTINTVFNRFIVTSCVCPMLKKFRMKVQWEIFESHEEDFRGVDVSTGEESRGIAVTRGIRPTNPFIELVDFDHDDKIVEFNAGERDFVGTIVPDSCIVEVHLEMLYTDDSYYM